MLFFVYLDDFVDKNSTIPNFSLVNQPSLDKILKVKVFIHSNGQLRAAHLILGYTHISNSFQVSKCVIKAKDPHLHQISIAVLGFLTTDPIRRHTKGSIAILTPCQGRGNPVPAHD